MEYRYCWTTVGQIHRVDPVTQTGTAASSTDPDRQVKSSGTVKTDAARCDGDAAQGNDTLFTYNSRHEQTGIDKPAGGDRTMGYDALSRLATVVDGRGIKIAYTYDGYDRVVKTEYFPTASSTTPSKTIEWTYDQAGNKTRLDDDNGGSNRLRPTTS